MAAATSPATPAASPATSGSNRGRRLSKVHRATEWLKPSFARSSATMPAARRDQMPKPSCVSCQLGSPTTTRFTRTRLSDIVHPVSSSQLTQDPDRVRSFGGYNTRKALDIIESETRDLVHSGAPTRKSETDVEIAPLVQKMGATSIAEVEKMIGELASGKRFSGIRGGASSARGGALCHPHPDGVGLGKNHLRYRRRMARGGPPLTRPFEILPI